MNKLEELWLLLVVKRERCWELHAAKFEERGWILYDGTTMCGVASCVEINTKMSGAHFWKDQFSGIDKGIFRDG